MRYASTLRVLPRVVGRTPRAFGINVEIQEHHDALNLWDWLADSGASIVREFHPEVSLRRAEADTTRWEAIRDRESFESWRRRVLEDPTGGAIAWDEYRFGEVVPWLGCPDGLIGKVREAGLQPLYSLGYSPREFPRPLVIDTGHIGPVEDEGIDWGAAASAYDYFFAEMYHYATRHGARFFTMINEPENRWDWFHLPPKLAYELRDERWVRTSWNEERPEVAEQYFGCVGTQVAVMARLARMALTDVAALTKRSDYLLTGPTNVVWEPMWALAAPYLDACDAHHYHKDHNTFTRLYTGVKAAAAAHGKGWAVTEFNRISGGIPIQENLFGWPASLQMARLIMTVLGLTGPEDPDCLLATFYLLNFPSTHRNYKHLLYGDMNLVDWTGRDRPLWDRGEAWRPTAEEMQARFPTPAYSMFRMLARCAPRPADAPEVNNRAAEGAPVDPEPYKVLDWTLFNPTSAGPEDIHDHLEALVVDGGATRWVTLLNASDRPAPKTRLELPPCWVLEKGGGKSRVGTGGADSAGGGGGMGARPAWWAVVRETSRDRWDEATAVVSLAEAGGALTLKIPPLSMTQVILTAERLDRVRDLRLVETTCTPGGVAGLARWQTTRLRVLGQIAGRTVDLTELGVVFRSDAPEIIRVYQGGLVQRLRDAAEPTTISARLLGADLAATVTIPGC